MPKKRTCFRLFQLLHITLNFKIAGKNENESKNLNFALY